MDNIVLYITIYSIFTLVSFYISLVFIMKKIEMKWYLGLIPIVNLYYYMKIIRLNPIWAFIPGINVIVFIASPILLGYHFGLPYWARNLGILLPGPLFLFIAFNPRVKYIHRKLSSLNITSYKDIDILEKKVKDEIEEYNNENDVVKKKRKKIRKRKDDYVEPERQPNMIDVLEQKLSTMQKDDVIVTDEDLINVVKPELDKKDENVAREQLVLDYDIKEATDLNSNDTFEDINKEDVDMQNVEKIEKESIESNKVNVTDNTVYEELKEDDKSVSAIAFNVDEKDLKDKEKITVLESKSEINTLKCPRCGSDLAGAKDHCPGCGADIRDLVNQT